MGMCIIIVMILNIAFAVGILMTESAKETISQCKKRHKRRANKETMKRKLEAYRKRQRRNEHSQTNPMCLQKAVRINQINNASTSSERFENNDSRDDSIESFERAVNDSNCHLRDNKIANNQNDKIPAASDSTNQRQRKRLPIVIQTSEVSELDLDNTIAPL